jgi:putative membrane protein
MSRRHLASLCTLASFVCLCCFVGTRALAQSGHEGMDKSDKKFIDEAAQGGMAEVKLGQLAAEKASSEDVKKFGQMMVDDHTKANEELKSLAQKKMVDLPTDIGKHQKTYDKLSKLSGSDFDKAYMDAMVKDHKEDVSEFEKQAARGQDSELKAWAAKTLPTLQMHLSHAEDLHKAMKG